MNLQLQESSNKNDLNHDKWDFAFIGEKLDDRGDQAIKFGDLHSTKLIIVKYSAEEMVLSFDGKDSSIDDIEDDFKFLQNKKILIESTTVNFVELLLILQQAKINNCHTAILYLEPKSYSKKRTSLIVHRREFELSEQTLGFYPVPGFVNTFGSTMLKKTIFIAGYESERISRTIEENAISSNNCDLIFGVPAFKVGWEMNSFANNITLIKEHRFINEPFYSSATNPGTTYDVLANIYGSLDTNEKMFIAPLGPKPAGIAAALFLINHDDVSLFYDHPSKKSERSTEVSKWHLYTINFGNND
jgi:hypothetical protein